MTRSTNMEHVELLERLRIRWAGPDERVALTAAIAALSAPQPPAEPTNRAESSSKLVDGQPTAEAKPDRMAIKLLVAAGFVTEAKANEALNIAHGFCKGPLAPPSAPGCGSCSDGCVARGTCRVRDESPPSAPVEVKSVEAALQKWLDWCNEHDEEPDAWAGARIVIEALAQQPAAVDDAMVERALNARYNGYDVACYLDEKADGRCVLHAALTAALAAQQGGGK